MELCNYALLGAPGRVIVCDDNAGTAVADGLAEQLPDPDDGGVETAQEVRDFIAGIVFGVEDERMEFFLHTFFKRAIHRQHQVVGHIGR